MKKLFTPFRVGLLVIVSGVLLFGFLSFVRKGGLSRSESITVFASFKDASGLGKKSRVQIAGIPVGEIDRIVLEHGRALVYLKIRRDVGLHVDAALRKRSESLLGDYMLDLYPGSDGAPLMPDEGEIKSVLDQQGMEAVFESLGRIAGDVEQVTSSLRKVLGGEKGTASLDKIVENLVRLSTNVDATVTDSSVKLNAILTNFEQVSRDVRGVTGDNQRSINEIVENVRQVSQDAQKVMTTVRKIVGGGEGEAEVQENVASLKETLSHLDHTLGNLEQVTSGIKEGKGAVGALLTDERMGQRLSETVEDISDFANRLTRLQVEVNLKTEYLFSQGASKNTLGIRLIPKPDKYYLIELIDDPRGSVDTTIVQTNPPATGQPATQVQRTTRDSLKFTAQFAKRYYFLALRFGITESTGGLGADLFFLNDALSLRFDAFNFSAQQLTFPRLRATLRFQALEHLFLTAGVDDMLNAQVRDSFTNRLSGGRDYFFGGGVYFTDDDLKSILTVAPLPKP